MFDAISHRLKGLRTRYAEPHRAYHTQAHIDAMLAGFRDLDRAIVHADAVELAIWYHDAIYDPAAADNEHRSAELLRAKLAGLVDHGMLAQAEALVRWTADHRIPSGLPPDQHLEAALFLDLDMAGLGTDRTTFDAYERGIAAEFVPVYGSVRFGAGRMQFLNAMLERPRLFHSTRFHQLYDAAARTNLRRALARLQQANSQ